jgi:hypothetical protein
VRGVLLRLAVMFVAFAAWYLISLPSVEEKRAVLLAKCPESKPVTVNGEFVGCTGGAPNGGAWTPDHDWRDVKLVPLSRKTQDWIDAP